jgi:hypothetical protein
MATANMDVMFRLENFVADSLSNGFFSSSIIPKLSGINERNVSIWKSMLEEYRFIKGIIRNEMVVSTPETVISLKPNSRPLTTINVIFSPNLSPSMSGISTLTIKNSCENANGTAKRKK